MARVAPPEEGAAAPHGEFGDIIKSRSAFLCRLVWSGGSSEELTRACLEQSWKFGCSEKEAYFLQVKAFEALERLPEPDGKKKWKPISL